MALIILISALGALRPVGADDLSPGTSLVVFGPAVAGVYDAGSPPMGFVEYRYTTGRFRPGPWLALEATAHDLFVGFGLALDLPLGRRWVFTPSVGAGIYQEHDGLGLGSPLEIRSTAELTRRLKRVRFGAGFEHLSNFGTGDHNPGTEIVKVLWVIPLPRSGSSGDGGDRLERPRR